MEATTRQLFCGDTLNIFGHEDKKFQWPKAYSYYSSPPAQKDVIWASGIARIGCAPEIFTVKNLLHCAWRSTCQARVLYNSKIFPPFPFHHKFFARC